jgi:hypothetical protein
MTREKGFSISERFFARFFPLSRDAHFSKGMTQSFLFPDASFLHHSAEVFDTYRHSLLHGGSFQMSISYQPLSKISASAICYSEKADD